MPGRLEQLGALPVGNSPQEFAQQMSADLARWAQVVKAAGVQVE